jgi:predicted methyltransferase
MTVLEGHPAQTNLPEECCDAIYLRQVYHHIEDPSSMNTSLLKSLKPGGRLAVIDFPPVGSEEQPKNRTSGSSHGVTADTVIEELRQTGFKLVNHEDKLGRNYYIVMQKPADQR